METLKSRIFPFVVCAILSSSFLYSAVKAYRQASLWWELPATLTSIEVRPTTIGGGSKDGNRTRRGFGVFSSFTYMVGAQELTGSGDEVFSAQQTAEDYANEVKGRQPLIVHVNPANPSEAVLDPQSNWWWIAGCVSALMAGVGILALCGKLPEIQSFQSRSRRE